MRHKTKKLPIKFNKVNILKIGTLLLLLTGIYWIYNRLFFIQTINCQTLEGQNCPVPIEAELASLIGKNLLFLEVDHIEKKILESSKQYQSITFEKKLPASLDVSIDLTQNVVQLFASNELGYISVLENYIPFEQNPIPNENLNLITIESSHVIKLGQPLESQQLKGSIDLVNLLEQEFITYKNFRLASDSAKVELSSGQIVLFDPQSNINKQVISLLMLKQSLLEESVLEIDLRFDKPILRYRQ